MLDQQKHSTLQGHGAILIDDRWRTPGHKGGGILGHLGAALGPAAHHPHELLPVSAVGRGRRERDAAGRGCLPLRRDERRRLRGWCR
jgi:hypothetical protein